MKLLPKILFPNEVKHFPVKHKTKIDTVCKDKGLKHIAWDIIYVLTFTNNHITVNVWSNPVEVE